MVRNEYALEQIQNYIRSNPLNWNQNKTIFDEDVTLDSYNIQIPLDKITLKQKEKPFYQKSFPEYGCLIFYEISEFN